MDGKLGGENGFKEWKAKVREKLESFLFRSSSESSDEIFDLRVLNVGLDL